MGVRISPPAPFLYPRRRIFGPAATNRGVECSTHSGGANYFFVARLHCRDRSPRIVQLEGCDPEPRSSRGHRPERWPCSREYKSMTMAEGWRRGFEARCAVFSSCRRSSVDQSTRLRSAGSQVRILPSAPVSTGSLVLNSSGPSLQGVKRMEVTMYPSEQVREPARSNSISSSVVQAVGHETLILAILVRVQAGDPVFFLG